MANSLTTVDHYIWLLGEKGLPVVTINFDDGITTLETLSPNFTRWAFSVQEDTVEAYRQAAPGEEVGSDEDPDFEAPTLKELLDTNF